MLKYKLQFLSRHTGLWTDVGGEFRHMNFKTILEQGRIRQGANVFKYKIVEEC